MFALCNFLFALLVADLFKKLEGRIKGVSRYLEFTKDTRVWLHSKSRTDCAP